MGLRSTWVVPAKQFGLKYVNSSTGHISYGVFGKRFAVGRAVAGARSNCHEMSGSGAVMIVQTSAWAWRSLGQRLRRSEHA